MPPSSLLRRIGEMFPPGRQRPSRNHPNKTPPRRAPTPEDAADVDTNTIVGKAFARRFVNVNPMMKEKMNHNTNRDHQKREGLTLRLPSTNQRPTTRKLRHPAQTTGSPTSTGRAQIHTRGCRTMEVAHSSHQPPPTPPRPPTNLRHLGTKVVFRGPTPNNEPPPPPVDQRSSTTTFSTLGTVPPRRRR
jgi:hypothetical protein